MLKIETDFIREFPSMSKTDRDAEATLLIEYIQKIAGDGKIESVLDVGAKDSALSSHYAKQIRPYVKRYDGVDIVNDPTAEKILDHYYVGNAIEYPYEVIKYDTVICVSTIEHSGVSTYKADPKTERLILFTRCLRLARRHFWISFPVGQEYTYPDQFSVVTEKDLLAFEQLARAEGFQVTERFLYTQGSPAGFFWREHKKRDVALKIPYIDFIGNQSICVMELTKI